MTKLLENLENRRLMATFAVTNNADSGTGSLRWAIQQSNLTSAADVVQFNLPSASTTISPTTALPSITAPLTIDATTQPGYVSSPLVTLSGANAPTAGAGFDVQTNDVLIRGLSIGNYSNNGAAVIAGVNSLRTTVRDCYLGVATNGITAIPNFDGFRAFGNNAQVLYSNVSGNTRFGVWLSESGCKVLNSTVGLTPAGSAPLGNGNDGVYINHGGFCFVGDSVISSNGGFGVNASGPLASDVFVDGCIIGLSPGRTALRTNGNGGVRFSYITNGSITDSRVSSGNGPSVRCDDCSLITIQGNNIGFGTNLANDFGGTDGILLQGSHDCVVRTNQIGHHDIGVHLYASFENTIVNNGIGSLLDNLTAIPNGKGIRAYFSNDNIIGTDAEPNVISRNTAEGVHVESGVRNAILGNRYRNNGGLDIDLGTTGVTFNDAGDADTGGNTLLNTISSVYGAYNPQGAATTVVSYRAGHEFTTPGAYRVDFYASENNKTVNDIGEGTRFLATRTISFTGQGESIFTSEIPQQIDGTYITATVSRLVNGIATDTSEFSKAMRVEGNPQILGSSFEYETGHAINFRFSRSVINSVTADDVTIRNLATNQIYTATSRGPASGTFSYNWYFNTLPDGNYRATLNRDTVGATVQLGPTTVGLPCVGPNTVDFFVLKGDATRDRTVNFDDLLRVAQNYGGTGKTFSQGDFNYDHKVDFDDLLTVAQRYGTSLFSAAPSGQVGNDKFAESVSRDVLA